MHKESSANQYFYVFFWEINVTLNSIEQNSQISAIFQELYVYSQKKRMQVQFESSKLLS